tara:strand:+ start:318 stop:503 length:186 start_codon:yes stop_codon:yes gene_type:complete
MIFTFHLPIYSVCFVHCPTVIFKDTSHPKTLPADFLLGNPAEVLTFYFIRRKRPTYDLSTE